MIMPFKRKEATPAATAAEKRARSSNEPEVEEDGEKADVSSGSARPVLVLAHGAGASSSSDWMLRWKELLRSATDAVEVVTFDYPYVAGGKLGPPPKAEKLVDFHLAQAKKASSRHPGRPVVLVGKSMGSRVSCMVAGRDDVQVAAVICLGYPLKGMNGAIRDQILLELPVPVLFVQGSKDSMCPLEKLDQVRKMMTAQNQVHVIKGGDHSFKVAKQILKEVGKSQDESDKQASEVVGAFLKKVLGSEK